MAEVPEGDAEAERAKEAHAQALSEDFHRRIMRLWVRYQRKEQVLTPSEFYRTTALTLMAASAVVAVDCGISYVQFLGMAKKLHDEITSKAPKFS